MLYSSRTKRSSTRVLSKITKLTVMVSWLLLNIFIRGIGLMICLRGKQGRYIVLYLSMRGILLMVKKVEMGSTNGINNSFILVNSSKIILMERGILLPKNISIEALSAWGEKKEKEYTKT